MRKLLLTLAGISAAFAAYAQTSSLYDCEKYRVTPDHYQACQETMERMTRAKEAYDKEINKGGNIPVGEPLPEDDEMIALPPDFDERRP